MKINQVIKNLKKIKSDRLLDKIEVAIQKYAEVDSLAIELPHFKAIIIGNEFTVGKLTERYKSIHFAWGVYRYLFTSKNKPPNFKGRFKEQHLFEIYINPVMIYDSDKRYGLDDLADLVYHYDNSTFYCRTRELIPLLDALAEWREKALHQLSVDGKDEKDEKEKVLLETIKKAQEELEELK